MQEMNQIPERWYSTKEMCTYLGVTRDTLLTWINEKGMPAHKVGGGWKYKPSEVDEWIKRGMAADEYLQVLIWLSFYGTNMRLLYYLKQS